MRPYPRTELLIVDDRDENLFAMEALLEHEVALILMDIQMPEMDGYEATRIIRNDEYLSSRVNYTRLF